jgi:uncharacterized protein YfeS
MINKMDDISTIVDESPNKDEFKNMSDTQQMEEVPQIDIETDCNIHPFTKFDIEKLFNMVEIEYDNQLDEHDKSSRQKGWRK